MTQQSDIRGAQWLFKHEWGFDTMPPAEDFAAYHKSLMICAKGDGVLAPEEREWVIGYTVAMGADPALVDELSTYQADDDIVQTISTARVADAARGACVFDAIRACAADGDLAPAELDRIRTMAGELGVGDLVDRLYDLYRQEERIRAERNKLLYPAGAPL
ncbi:hypothetical protein [Nocardia wallacei]|uniref:hypothetical protein n=1 Tax=Nocardia wallacei TaxID=480035 RepID=UPI00245729EC|nr:hypothetical protein [Nocardia wallacei]